MVTIQINTWIFWLITICFVLCIMSIYRKMVPHIEMRSCIMGIGNYYKHKYQRYKQHSRWRTISFSAKFVKEMMWFIIASVVAYITICYVCGWCNMSSLIDNIVDVINSNFTTKYPLLTTIIGAYFALLCHHLFLHPKVYVSPNACLYTDLEGRKRLSWFIENRCLFDSVDIHVDAFACKYIHKEDDLQTYRINLKRADYPVLSGRLAASNDRSISVSTFELPKDVYKKGGYKFDYLELSVKVTHSLSHVTKIITRQFNKEDIYKGEFCGGKKAHLSAFQNPRTTINTIKDAMLQRFMYARKFETISLMSIIGLTLLHIIWPDVDIQTLGITSILFVVMAISLLWFGITRLFYQFPVFTEKNDENKQYRANIDTKFKPQNEANNLQCPYLATINTTKTN